jgi:phenol 2-monooxygenase
LHPFDYFGIDRSLGCAVIVRPDQHVAACFALDDTAAIQAFFEHCLLYP